MKSLKELSQVFGRIGLLSFGGPAAQIALMHKELVETREWLTEAQFLRALSFCMLLPGPEAMQLATYAGWKQRGIIGGLIGGGLFVIPGAIVIGILALAYGAYGDLGWMQSLFLGVKAAVVIIVVEALLKVSKRALKVRKHYIIAGLAFITLFIFAVPFPVVIFCAAVVGAVQSHVESPPVATALPWAHSGKIILVGLLIWAAPIVIATALHQDLLVEIGLFFSKLAIVTFGGAYAVLAYMTQAVVNTHEWLTTAQMMDALGLAETTPGPLILVTQFVGMLAGHAAGGVGVAITAGIMTLWVTFVPCFIWIFAGAPLIDWLEGRPKLSAALTAITAAVVGVIANLTVWFSLHVFFGEVKAINFGPVHTISPIWSTVQGLPIALAALAGFLLLKRHWSLPWVLLICAGLSLLAASQIQPL